MINSLQKKLMSLFLCLFLTVAAGGAYADCADPAGKEGEQVYNATYKTMQFCDGTRWWSMKGGAGSGSNVSMDECQPGEAVIYSSTNNRLECPYDHTPDAFSFTNQTGTELSTSTESEIVQINDIDDGLNISVSGDGSPEYRICDDATCSGNPAYTSAAGTINSGQYVQLHLTSNSSYETLNSVTLTIGDSTNQWDVKTKAEIPTEWTVRGGVYASAGTYTYTVPSGVSYIKVQAWGGPGARGAMCIYSCCAWNNYSGGDNPGSTFAVAGGATLLASLGGTSSVGTTAGTGRGYSIEGSVISPEGYDGSNVAPCNPAGPGFSNCITNYPSQYYDYDTDGTTVLWNPSASGWSGDTCGCTAKSASGGNGGYASGIIAVTEGEEFTVTVAQSPGHTCTESGGAWHASASPGRVVVWEP